MAGKDRDWRQSALLEGFGKETENLERNESSTPPFRALRGEDVLYVEYETGERELYDLRQDPFELSNLAQQADKSLLRAFSANLTGFRRARDKRVSRQRMPRRRASTTVHPANRETRKASAAVATGIERERSHQRRSVPPAGAVAIAETGESMDPLRLTLSRRDARSPRLRLRVHVASVDSPGTLVAAVELPGSGGRERLSGVSVREPGWLALDMGGALGDTREIVVSLRARDGAALMVSGPDSSLGPEVVSHERTSFERQRTRRRPGQRHSEKYDEAFLGEVKAIVRQNVRAMVTAAREGHI